MIFVFWVVLLSLFSPAILQATEKPVVLSMCTVSDYTSPKRFDATSALRFQIVSKLIQSQDCVMVCRSMSECLTFEQEILQLKALDAGKEGGDGILAADYAIRIHLRRTDDNKGVRIFAIIKDLKHDLSKEPDRVIWDLPLDCVGPNDAVREYNKLADSISAKIAEHLKLPPRSRSMEVESGSRSAPVWAVLPFETLDGTQARGESPKQQYWRLERDVYPESMLPDVEKFWVIECGINSSWTLAVRPKNSAMMSTMAQLKEQMWKEPEVMAVFAGDQYVPFCELALQANGIKNIVDRIATDKVLKELKLKTLLGVNENLGACVSRLLGADRLVMGCVVKESGGFRLLVQLVDSATSSVIDAGDRYCSRESDLGNAIRDTMKEFSQGPRLNLAIPPSTIAQRHAEGQFYYEYFHFASSRSTPAYKAEWLDRSKIAYYLLRDDKTTVAKIIIPRFEAIVDQCSIGRNYGDDRDLPQQDIADSAAFHLDMILSSLDEGDIEASPLVRRAKAFAITHFYDKALPLIVEHRKRHPGNNKGETLYLESLCRYWLGEIAEAEKLIRLALMQQDCDQRPACELALTIARDPSVKDEKLEYLALQIRQEIAPSLMPPIDYVRFFKITERVEGPGKALDLPHDSGEEAAVLKGDILFKIGKYKAASEMYAIRQGKLKSGVIKSRSPYVDDQLARIKALSGLTIDTAVSLVELPSIMKFPDKYKIYCYPMAGTSRSIVEGVATRIGKNFGTTVMIQPEVPFPKLAEYDKKRECYNFPDLSRRVLKGIKIPQDAVFMYVVTPVQFVPAKSEYGGTARGAPKAGNPIFASEAVRPEDANVDQSENGRIKDIVNSISWSFITCVLAPIPATWGGGDPDDANGGGRGFKGRLFFNVMSCEVTGCGWFSKPMLCPQCAKGYSLANFEKAHQALQGFMSRADKALTADLQY